jgi:hypothetical protein
MKMRHEIDSLRKELSSAFTESHKLKKNITKTKREAESQNKDYVSGKKVSEEVNN